MLAESAHVFSTSCDIARVSKQERPLYDEIVSYLTHGGIIDHNVALNALTDPERCLLDLTREADTIRVARPNSYCLDNSVFVFLKSGPRLGIKACYPGLKQEDVLGAFRVSESSQERYQARWWRYNRELAAAMKRVTAFLEKEEHNGTLGVLVESIQSAVEHLAPIINFVGDQVYSSEAYWTKNIGGRENNRLKALREAPVCRWQYEDRCFVFAISVLLKTGGAYRLEEMNWRQVDPVSLERYLLGKFQGYLLLVPELGRHRVEGAPPHELADRLRQVEQELATRLTLIRTIDGPTLNKRVCLIPKLVSSPPLPEGVALALSRLLPGGVPSPDTDPRGFIRGMARIAIATGRVSQTISQILALALSATDADFIMSRCNRKFYLKQNIGRLTQDDFFCAVLCSVTMRQASPPGRLSIEEIMWRQSKRMLFNCWKFWYGNLTDSERLPNQYWFIPPRMGDVSYHEDRLHAGHAEGLVAQAIRVPGDITFHDVETGEDRTMIAAMDIRAARANMDRPFGTREYLIAERYARVLNLLYDEFAAVAREKHLVEVESFRKADFLAETR